MSSSKNPRCFARYNALFTLARLRLWSPDSSFIVFVPPTPVVDIHRIGVDDPLNKPPSTILDVDVDVDVDVIIARTAKRRSVHIVSQSTDHARPWTARVCGPRPRRCRSGGSEQSKSIQIHES